MRTPSLDLGANARRMHVFADLQSYMCTFDDCKQSLVTFPSRRSWADHEFTSHRYREYYRCGRCEPVFETMDSFEEHVRARHCDLDKNVREWIFTHPLITLVERKIEEEECNLCQQSEFKDRRSFVTHVSRHLEQVALVSLPASMNGKDEPFEESEMDTDAESGPLHAVHPLYMAETLRSAFNQPDRDELKYIMRQRNFRMPPFLIDRIANEQKRRCQKLMHLKQQHDKEEFHHEDTSGSKNTQDLRVSSSEVALPAGWQLPGEFECPYCYRMKKLTKMADWINHVLEDLQAYTCTFEACTDPKPFKRKADWMRHENERHRHLEWWQCSLEGCSYRCFRKDNFVQHLVREHKLQVPGGPVPELSGHNTFCEMVETYKVQSSVSPKEEPCRYCGLLFDTWKELMAHMAAHMEMDALPLLGLVTSNELVGETLPSPEDADFLQPAPQSHRSNLYSKGVAQSAFERGLAREAQARPVYRLDVGALQRHVITPSLQQQMPFLPFEQSQPHDSVLDATPSFTIPQEPNNTDMLDPNDLRQESLLEEGLPQPIERDLKNKNRPSA